MPCLKGCSETSLRPLGVPFRVCLSLLLGLTILRCAHGAPVVVPDERHPGYYKPFRCLSIDRTAQGGHKRAEIRNNCGFAAEAYWSGGQWTVPAGEWHPLFIEPKGDVLGCLPNDYLNPALQLCKGATNTNSKAEADRLAKELGISSPNSSTPITPNSQTEAAQLAQQLGVSTAPGNSTDYSAAQLQRDIDKWEEQERLRREAEERQRRLREEQERVAAAQRAQREELIRQQQLEIHRQQALERQASSDESDDEPGLFGTLLGTVAKGYIAKEMGMDPAQAILSDSVQSSRSSSSNDRPSSDACSSPEISRMYAECATIQVSGALCPYYRAAAACLRRLEAASAGCPEYSAQVRQSRADAERGAAQVCTN